MIRKSHSRGRGVLAAAAVAAVAAVAPASAQETMRLGVVTFVTGAAAGPFGIPARNAAELLIEAINAGKVPEPYAAKGIGGAAVEMILVDEAGTTTQVVQEYRNLVERRNADAVVGYISSGSCLAVTPVAEELKKLTVFFDCGTPRVFEEAARSYVFRTASHATMDGVGAARYVVEKLPDVKSYGGINQNYAWGQDSWRDFNLAMQALKPGIKVTTEQFPKLFQGQFSAEISALLLSGSDVVHSSFWNGDLESFVVQQSARALHTKSRLVLTAGETAMFRLGAKMPDGVVIGARGPFGVLARKTPLNDWFRQAYHDRFNVPATYPSYHMAHAILGLKAAADKAAAAAGKRPTTEQIAKAFEYLEFEGVGTKVRMAIGKGHQAITETAYGTYKFDKSTGEPTLVDITHYPAECVNPPDGVDSVEWIKSGMKGAKC
ncbi:MAG: ABC transporter substrate-binding protein [Alphaproteobacteria bacterium]|nr:ABC transporter substrate-binding protein [Alphaproteobacteria bacterium]